MSLHVAVAAPPLCLAVHPAPASKASPAETDADKRRREPSGRDDTENKPEDKPTDKGKDDAKADAKAETADDGKAADKDEGKKDRQPEEGHKADKHNEHPARLGNDAIQPDGPPTPVSLSSMRPQPPTPAPNAPVPPGQVDDAAVPEPKSVKPAHANAGKPDSVTPIKATDGKPHSTSADSVDEPQTEPLRLLGPAPPRPLKARLDIDQDNTPYPAVYTDLRGAYYLYASDLRRGAVGVDVTKDGWLTEEWHGRSEREALARLNGEAERQARREMERDMAKAPGHKVPKESGEILKQLWNECAHARNHEVQADVFWSRYDWADPAAQVHLLDVSKQEGQVPSTIEGVDVEWTKEGLEEILATAGIQCAYNMQQTASRYWRIDATCGYLIMGHGFFMLRLEDHLQWRSERVSTKFEVLVTSGHDRVFGAMVQAQQAEQRKKIEKEYTERKEREYEERKVRKEKEKKEKEQKDKERKGKERQEETAKGDKGDKEDDKPVDARVGKGKTEVKVTKEPDTEEKDQHALGTEAKDTKRAKDELQLAVDDPPGDISGPPSPGSNVRVKDGEPVERHVDAPVLATKGGMAVVAVPVQNDKLGDLAQEDRHEAEAMVAPPRPTHGDDKDDKEEAVEKNTAAPGGGKEILQPAFEGVEQDRNQDDKNETGEPKKVNGDAAAGQVRLKDAQPKDSKDARPIDAKAKDDKAKDDKAKPSAPRKESVPLDPMRDAELIAKMIQASGGGPDGPIGLEEIKLAFKALEMAAQDPSFSPARAEGGSGGEGYKKEPLIWAWSDSCEKWRWKNFEAGAHEVGPGGWEERDWKVFADQRGCDEFDEEEEWAEEEEEDVHDWSC